MLIDNAERYLSVAHDGLIVKQAQQRIEDLIV
jgi:hypothetical protein